MNRYLPKYTFIALSIIFFFSWPPSHSAGEQTIKVGIPQLEPLVFTDSDGEVKGLFADILDYAASREGWTFEYVPGTWAQTLLRLENKDIDILGPIAFSEERDVLLDFSKENVLTNWAEIYTRKGSHIYTMIDLEGKKVGIMQNDIHSKALKHLLSEFGIQCEFIDTDDYSAVLELVANQEVDAGVVNRFTGIQSASTYDLGTSTIIFNPITVHYAVPAGGNTHLLTVMDKHIASLKDDKSSVYYRSLDRWLNVKARAWVIPHWLKILLFSGGGTLLLLFFGNMVLRSQVRAKTRELARELDERRQTEDLIQFKNTILSTQQETSLDGIVVIDESGKMVSFNQRYADMWQIPPQILHSQSEEQALQAVLHQVKNPEQFLARVKYLYAHRNEQSFEVISLIDGRMFERYSAPMVSPDDRYYGRVWYFRDVTERQNTERALRESEEKYRDLFENADLLIQSIDTNGVFQHVNKKWKETLGYREEEIAQLTIWDIIHPDSVPHCKTFFSKILDGDKIATFETVFLTKEGQSIPVEGHSSCRFKDGMPEITRGIFRDISERKRSEEEKAKLEALLYHSQNMEAIGTLAGGVAHDLNNVLSGIVSYPELLLMELPEDSPLREPILTIKKSGDKAASIVQDLLTLARRGVAVNDVVNLNHIISDYLESHEFGQVLLYHPKVVVEKQLQDGLLNMLGSTIHLSKMLMNLISNAAEAMPDGGTISISTENRYVDIPPRNHGQIAEGEYVVVCIADTGIGISEKDQKRIFEPFYTKKAMGRSGTGLGMAVVWGAVKDHRGVINVQSKKGQGTKFELYFPATREQIGEELVMPIAEYWGNNESILIVDDVKEQRDIASWMLTKLNYTVDSVASGEEALEYIREKTVDLLILDMIMDPGMDGYATYRAIRATAPDQKAIIASGFAENDRVRKAQNLGAGAYVKKPYSLEKIGLAVREELDRAEL